MTSRPSIVARAWACGEGVGVCGNLLIDLALHFLKLERFSHCHCGTKTLTKMMMMIKTRTSEPVEGE